MKDGKVGSELLEVKRGSVVRRPARCDGFALLACVLRCAGATRGAARAERSRVRRAPSIDGFKCFGRPEVDRLL